MIVLFLAAGPSATARDLFELTATVDGSSETVGFSNAEDFIDQMEDAALEALVPGYTPDSATTLTLDVRGLPAIAAYPEDSSTLLFEVPSLGIALEFQGDTRDESVERFRDFAKGEEGRDILRRLLRGFVSLTPVDPVAGNPNSAMAQAAVADYAMASLRGRANRLFDTGALFGWADADGFTINSQAVPFGVIQTRRDPGQLWILDGFLRRVEVAGGEVWDGSLGVGWRLGYLEAEEPALRWSITPTARASVVGSLDLGAGQAIYSTALNSRLEHARDDLLLAWNLMYGYYQTQGVSSEYAGDYGLSNQILRTGVELSGPLRFKVFDEPTTWQAHYVYTNVTGADWYYDGFNTLGFTIGTRQRPDRELWTALRLGLECDLADGYTGCKMLLGYQF